MDTPYALFTCLTSFPLKQNKDAYRLNIIKLGNIHADTLIRFMGDSEELNGDLESS